MLEENEEPQFECVSVSFRHRLLAGDVSGSNRERAVCGAVGHNRASAA